MVSSLALGLASDPALITGGSRDLSACTSPDQLGPEGLYQEVLLPALEAGWLPPGPAGPWTPASLYAEVYSADLDAMRRWAGDVLRAHPWPPGFLLPTFEQFVSSPVYLGEPPPTPRQLELIHNAAGKDAYEWFVNHRPVNCMVACWGKGAGKDLLSGEVVAYAAWTVVQMRNPWFHFNMPTGEVLDIINVAQDQDAAREVFFTKLKRMVERPCFQPLFQDAGGQKKAIQSDRIEFRRRLPGEPFPKPCVRINSLHSKNEGAEGRNTFLWVMDEADALRDAKGHGNARKMFATLTTSNRFGNRQLGLVISYPRAKNGFMFEMLQACGNRGGKTPEWYGDLAPTWEVLPWKSYQKVFWNGRWYEPDSEMQRLYRDDLELFRAMYGVEPPEAEDAFFSIPQKIDQAIAPWLKPVATVEKSVTVHRTQLVDGSEKEYRYVALQLRDLQLRPGVVYYVGADAGEVQDSFALCVAHAVPPREQGYLCPVCWKDRKLRFKKHYRPAPLPPEDDPGSWIPEMWACDTPGCRRTPERRLHLFWGVCQPSGRVIQRPQITGYDRNGEPLIAKDAKGDDVFEEVTLPLVVQDLLLEWQPDRNRGLTVDFGNVRDLILQLAAVGSIGMVRIDKWNATQMIQELRERGLHVEAKTFGNPEQLAMYRNYKWLVNNNQVLLLPGEEKARRQLRELQLINGNKIDHPDYSAGGGLGGKDLTDAEAMAFEMAVTLQYSLGSIDMGDAAPGERLMNEQAQYHPPAPGSLVNRVLSGRL